MSAHANALLALAAIEDALAEHRAGGLSASLAVSSVERIVRDYEASVPADREHASRQAAERMRESAEAFARRAHVHQTNLSRRPYTEHLERVAARARAHAEALSRKPEFAALCEQAGWLHATIEDAGTTADDLRAVGFDPAVVRAVERLTRLRGSSYSNHVRTLVASGDLIAMTVKLADNEDHIDPSQPSTADIPPDQITRYAWSAALLRNNLLPNGSANPVNWTADSLPERRVT